MMKWNVYYHSINSDSIVNANIFQHAGFHKDVVEALKTQPDKMSFAAVVKSSLLYYFWSKAEWEVLITAWCGGKAKEKIDVYDQVWNNWDVFIDYLWGFKETSNGT